MLKTEVQQQKIHVCNIVLELLFPSWVGGLWQLSLAVAWRLPAAPFHRVLGTLLMSRGYSTHLHRLNVQEQGVSFKLILAFHLVSNINIIYLQF